MTPSGAHKSILFVSLKEEAQPVLSELRAAGHQVSLVEDLEGAQALLTSKGFHQAVIPAANLELLLEQRSLWEATDADSWRRSTAAIAYDLRNLLLALEENVKQLEPRDSSGLVLPDLEQMRHSISVLSGYLLELTDELGAGGGRQLSLSTFDLEDAVETAAMTAYPSASERKQRLVIDIDEAVGRIEADATKLRRILSNLLDHASRNSASLATVTVRAHREQDCCVISVTYTDATMTLAGLRRLFSPAAGEFPASGLSRVQKLVQQHGGRLWVESEKWSGTSIFVSLPLTVASHAEFLAAAGL